MWVETIENKMKNGGVETICTTHRKKYNSELFDMINFVLLYVIPLAIMTVSNVFFFELTKHTSELYSGMDGMMN